MNHRGTEAQRDPLTQRIIGAAIEVHRNLGPGLLESVYEECLCWGLKQVGLDARRQVILPVVYKGMPLDLRFKIDVVVADAVLLELKCVEKLAPIHEAQLLTYLKLTRLHTGLLINFHIPHLRNGIKRMVL